MCVQDADKLSDGMEDMTLPIDDDESLISHSGADSKENPSAATTSFPVGKIC